MQKVGYFESLTKGLSDNKHRGAAMIASLWHANIPDLLLGLGVHGICYAAHGVGGSCFYSTLGGIQLVSRRYIAAGIVLGANGYDLLKTPDASGTHLAHGASTAIGFLAGYMYPSTFGTGK